MTGFAEHTERRIATLAATAALDELDLIIEQRVLNDDGSLAESYQVHLGDGVVAVDRDCSGEAHVVLSQDVETAEALRSGELHAQPAFLTGRLRVDGDVDRLLEHREALTSLLAGTDA